MSEGFNVHTCRQEFRIASFMHLVLILVVVLIVGFFVWRATSAASTGPSLREGDAPPPPLAFLTRGRLLVERPGGYAELQSSFVQSAVDRQERARERHAWKEGTAFQISGRRMKQFDGDEQVGFRFASAVFAGPDKLLYFVEDQGAGGLFEHHLASGGEHRLLHRQRLQLRDLRLSVAGDKLYASTLFNNGMANIVAMGADGSGYRELTSGDTVDSAPCEVPPGALGMGERASGAWLVYQSSGIARNAEGRFLALGPSSIQLLDLERGSIEPIFEDPATDFLRPRVARDGSLYFLRRPYDGHQYRSRDLVTDTLLFPFRLVRALFSYLNYFSLMYTRKPLTSASGPALEQDLHSIELQGRHIDTRAALRTGRRVLGVPVLVPATWQLVCRTRQGEERVLASHVATYELSGDDRIVFSTGYGIFALDRDGSATPVVRNRFIGELAVL
jgi:hypothetical protein